MQVRSRDAARRADESKHFARVDLVAALHVDAAQVAVHRHDPRAVVDEHRVAVEEEIALVEDAARGRCPDRRAGGRRDVHARVRIARLAVEEPPESETARALAGHGWPHAQLRHAAGRVGAERGVDTSLLALDPLEVLLLGIHVTLVLHLEVLLRVFLSGHAELELARLGLAGRQEFGRLVARSGVERDADEGDPPCRARQHGSAVGVEDDLARRLDARAEFDDRDAARNAALPREVNRRVGRSSGETRKQHQGEIARHHPFSRVATGGLPATASIVAVNPPRASRPAIRLPGARFAASCST